MCSCLLALLTHSGILSFFQCLHFRMSRLSEDSLWLSQELFELASLGDQHFESQHAYSSYAMSLTLASHCLEQGRAATMIWTSRPDQSAVLLEEDPVAHFVILPNYEEDETVLRETLENLGCSPSAKKHMRMVLAMDRLVAATGHLLPVTVYLQYSKIL